jgi:hypothetical protein
MKRGEIVQRRPVLRRVAVLAILLAAGTVLLWAWRRAATPGRFRADPELLATIGPRQIRTADFVREISRRGGSRQELLDRSALLHEMIVREALLVRARAAGLEKDPDFIREWQSLLIGCLRRRELEPRLADVAVSDLEIQAEYERDQAPFSRPAMRRLAILFVATHPQMDPEARARCQARIDEARRKVLAHAGSAALQGFGALAVEYSEDQTTRYKGGDLGWVEDGHDLGGYGPAVVRAGFALAKVGDVSDIIATDRGLYLVRLADLRPAQASPLEDVRERIRHLLWRDKQRQVEKDFVDRALSAVAVKIFEDALERVPPTSPGQRPAAAAPPGLPR